VCNRLNLRGRLTIQFLILSAILVQGLFLGRSFAYDTQAKKADKRLLQVDDVLNLQQIGRAFGGPVAFSPDGKQLAFVIERQQLTKNFSVWALLGNDRSDIYILDSHSSKPINITNGLVEQAGYWAPSWSPDGSRLAMLSTKNGEVRVCVWQRTTRKIRQITNRNIDLYSVVDRPFVWVTSSTLLVNVLPVGEKTLETVGDMRVADRASRAWAKMRTGKEVSVSVLSSERRNEVQTRSTRQLIGIDIDVGRSWFVSDGAPRKMLVSPAKTAIAFVRKISNYKFDPGKPLPYEDWEGKFELNVTGLDGTPLLGRSNITSDVIPSSLRWSPEGNELAFLTYVDGTSKRPLLARFLTKARNALLSLTPSIDSFPGGREPPQLEWTNAGWLLYGLNPKRTTSTRFDWYLIPPTPPEHCVTCNMATPPSKLLPDGSHRKFVGLADGELWQISTDEPPLNLTADFNNPIVSIVWPQQQWRPDKTEMPTAGATYQELLVSTRSDNDNELYSADLNQKKLTQIIRPSPTASVIAHSPLTKTTLFSSHDPNGLMMWLSTGGSPRKIFEANLFLKNIASAIQRPIEYLSTDGQHMTGWVMLPPNYESTKKYPLIVYVYPINYLRPFDSISDPIYLNLQIAAARGYAVLCPTIPFVVEGPPGDPMLKLTAGVLPAVDKAIELGIADPNRLYVMGHSLGGFATYGIITQTNRFKGAVALGGLTNLISAYGQFDTVSRYDEFPHEKSSNQALVIESVLSLRSPPWQDMDRYVRNSPITYVSRVQTPLMIIQGDLDGIPIEQAEEFFMALQRQGKRAELVRYWGEGHVFQSPANIRDMWDRIVAWFDELPPRTDEVPSAGAQGRVSRKP
jgi:dipeptidyl aminopeptidase/acylaminoacyl peptidase